jgi:hypothetical protein
MNQNELTPEQQCMAQLFSVLCAVVQSEHTPRITVEATMQTLSKIFNDEDGPFMANDEVMGMTVAMIDSINGIISRRNKQTHQQMGEDILGNMNWN